MTLGQLRRPSSVHRLPTLGARGFSSGGTGKLISDYLYLWRCPQYPQPLLPPPLYLIKLYSSFVPYRVTGSACPVSIGPDARPSRPLWISRVKPCPALAWRRQRCGELSRVHQRAPGTPRGSAPRTFDDPAARLWQRSDTRSRPSAAPSATSGASRRNLGWRHGRRLARGERQCTRW